MQPYLRRDDRVVEGAALEKQCTGNCTVGSNPTLSANLNKAPNSVINSKIKYLLLFCQFLFLFIVFLALFIFLSFWLHVSVNSWTLVVAFLSYVLALTITIIIKYPAKSHLLVLALFAVATPLIFLGGTNLFGRTYDTNYDGLYYHEPAIMALADNWNPIYHPTFPLRTPQIGSRQLAEGNPKVLWAIDASIYKVANNIDSATLINLIFAFIAFVFVSASLLSLGIKQKLAVSIALCAVLTPLFLAQIFSTMEDSFGYDCLLIALASIIQINKKKHISLYVGCLFGAGLLLAGSKFSNLYFALFLVGLGIYSFWRLKLYYAKYLYVMVAGLLLAALLLLFNPLVTNVTQFHAITFPYNESGFTRSFRETGVPANIRHDSKLELFFYGIFSSSEISNSSAPYAYARLKAPLTFSLRELLIESQSTAKLVGGYGVLYSGIFIISIAGYLYLILRSKKRSTAIRMWWVHLGVVAIILDAFVWPIPNYARYNSQLYLLPVVIMVALSLIKKKNIYDRTLLVALIALVLTNFYFDMIPSFAIKESAFQRIDSQLSSLEASHKTYDVYSSTFYPAYTELTVHHVHMIVVNHPLQCKQAKYLIFAAGTQLCPVSTRSVNQK